MLHMRATYGGLSVDWISVWINLGLVAYTYPESTCETNDSTYARRIPNCTEDNTAMKVKLLSFTLLCRLCWQRDESAVMQGHMYSRYYNKMQLGSA